jgi:hypothetical protein
VRRLSLDGIVHSALPEAGGSVAMAHRHFGRKMREEVHAECVGSIEPFGTKGRYDTPGEFVVAGGVKTSSQVARGQRTSTAFLLSMRFPAEMR